MAEAMGEAVENDDAILLAETIDELTTYEKDGCVAEAQSEPTGRSKGVTHTTGG